MLGCHFINNRWVRGLGESFQSNDPASLEIVWEGRNAAESQIKQAVRAARKAFDPWSLLSVEDRLQFLTCFNNEVTHQKKLLIETISKENGKPLWESDTEVNALLNKLPIAIKAYRDRCNDLSSQSHHTQSLIRHKPHGVVAVLGPFNFPAHVPNGHMIPALLAGNTVILKPSQLTPLVSEVIMECYEKADFPAGVVNLIQGDGRVGKLLSEQEDLNGLFATCSYAVGEMLMKFFADKPQKILALEMGGNNPLIVHNVKNMTAAVYHTIQSSFITAGQRCTAARRLIVTQDSNGQEFIERLIEGILKIKVGPYTLMPEPFMGPVISTAAALKIETSVMRLLTRGAQSLIQTPSHLTKDRRKTNENSSNFLPPTLLDVTPLEMSNASKETEEENDEEIFGPVLQLTWVENFEQAIEKANGTQYGLAAGLLCDKKECYQQFIEKIRAGVITWNRATTGASSSLPFGGIGKSGNFRPTAFYAADYCAYPMSCMEESLLNMPQTLPPGLNLSD